VALGQAGWCLVSPVSQDHERVQDYGRRCHDAASVLFNLPEYRVVAVVRDDDHGRREVFVETPVVEAGCPSCGVLSSRVHQRTRQRMRDVGFDGLVRVWWVKKRWRCGERACPRVTFTESTEQVPPFARMTTRLKERIVAARAGEVRCVGCGRPRSMGCRGRR
jgi:hypothetical protein